MNPVAIPALLAFVSAAVLGALAYQRDPRAPINRAFACHAAMISVLTLSLFGYLQAETAASALAWLRMDATWPLLLALQLYFALVFTDRVNLLRSRVFWLAGGAFVGVALVFAQQLTPGRSPAGARWANEYVHPPDLNAFLLVYAAVINVASIGLCIRHVQTARLAREKRRAQLVLAGVALPGLWGTVCEGLLPLIDVYVSSLLPLGVGAGAGCVAYAIARFELFTLTPTVATAQILDTIEEGMLLVDPQRSIVAGNRAAADLLGEPLAALCGRPLEALLPPIAKLLPPEGFPGSLMAAPVRDAEVTLGRHGSQKRVFSVSAKAVPMQHEVIGAVVVLRDVTQSKLAAEQLSHSATHDFLTGLPNRMLLRDRMGIAIAQAARIKRQVAVLLLDLDGFKEINDLLGHDAGDALLKEVGQRLQRAVRACDTIARIGGDEFVVVLGEITDQAAAEMVASRIRHQLRAPFSLEGRASHVRASIGMSFWPSDGQDADTLLKCADLAMYAQKKGGGDGFTSFVHEMHDVLQAKTFLKSELESAAANGELQLHYQPLMDAVTQTISGMEALLRWQHPRLGLVSPATFIPVAESSGLIVPIGEWVLRTACRQAREWEQQGLGRLPVSVNLSAQQLRDAHLVQTVRSALSECELSPDRLVLEVTEGSIMENAQHAELTLRELHESGVRISIDDFGTGYSSLARIKTLPISAIKIDRSFVREIDRNPTDLAIVRAIVGMARNLELEVVAEGVETRAQCEVLCRLEDGAAGPLRVDQMQGYLFSRPVDAAAMSQLLARPAQSSVKLVAAVAQSFQVLGARSITAAPAGESN